MFNFSLKNLYDDKVGNYLLLIAIVKWASVILGILGALLAVWFNNYWWAILGGVLLAMIGFTVALITHFISNKIRRIVAMGGNLVGSTENYLKDRALQRTKKFITERNNKSNKSS